MTFKPNEVAILLAKVHRRCCICHRFCGVKIETDHIRPKADGGDDSIDNAIPVCFDCHAEIHSYNTRHPRGRRFRHEELRSHKEQWIEICRKQPSALVSSGMSSDVGPLQALIDELDYNRIVAEKHSVYSNRGALFAFDQFHRAIAAGSISVLEEKIKNQFVKHMLQ